uniref:SMODS and SLOG-associating 2TM effector domain-containing protein n=1 Tax=Prymnesium polylepis TaxID=72548 RepID=A0A7S4HWI5_9EUKA
MPITMGVVGTLRSKLRYKEKANACLMGAYAIVSEIYEFRLRAGPYDTTPQPSRDDDDGPELSPKQREQKARELCVNTCQEIYAGALSSEVSKGSALQHPRVATLNTAEASERAVFIRTLQAHVQKRLHWPYPGQAAAKRDRARTSKVFPSTKLGSAVTKTVMEAAEGAAAAAGMAADGGGAAEVEGVKKKGGEIDDFTSPLELEIYVEFRLRSCARRIESVAPGLALRLNALEFCALISNAVGGVLAIAGYAQWVSASVAAGIIFSSLQDYYSLSPQVTACNEATAALHSVLSMWDSLSLVQRKDRETKQKLVENAEAAILKPISAKTSSVSQGKGSGGEADDSGK